MHERERWQVIKAMLRERAVVRIADVLKATGASEASVRRDFAKLAETGVAMRVRGGVPSEARGDGEADVGGVCEPGDCGGRRSWR